MLFTNSSSITYATRALCGVLRGCSSLSAIRDKRSIVKCQMFIRLDLAFIVALVLTNTDNLTATTRAKNKAYLTRPNRPFAFGFEVVLDSRH